MKKALGVSCLLAGIFTGSMSPATYSDETVVRDGGVSIDRDTFEAILEATPDKIRQAAATDLGDRYALINQVMTNLKLVDEANRIGPEDPDYEELQSRLDKVKQQFAFERALGSYDLPDLRKLARERYDTQKDKYALVPETRASSHILFYSPPGPDRTELRERAAKVLAELRAGADFEAYVEEYSQDPGSAARGGSIDQWARLGDPGLSPPYTGALFEIEEVGGYSEVTDTQFGVHIIRLDGIRESSHRPFEEVVGAIMDDLIAEHRKLAMRSVRARYELTDEAFVDGDAMEELFAPYK